MTKIKSKIFIVLLACLFNGYFSQSFAAGQTDTGLRASGDIDAVSSEPSDFSNDSMIDPRPPRPGPRPHPGPGHGHWHPPFRGHHGHFPWAFWRHPLFVFPVYFWEWGRVNYVTCVATDSYGNNYPVTEDGYVGYGYRGVINEVQEIALNRCYAESGGDPGCYPAGCTPTYRRW